MRCKIAIIFLVLCPLLTVRSAGQMRPDGIELSDNGIYMLTVGENTFSVSAQTGGRIISFTCKGKELLLPSSVHDVNYGATLWPSPQCSWGWPPYPVLDTKAYQVAIEGNILTLDSRSDPASGYRFRKEFSLCPADSSILIEYSIYNRSDQEKKVAAWDVCRTNGGFSFFPVGEKANLPVSTLRGVTQQDGILWYRFCKDSLPEAQKLFSTACEGWLAHLVDGLLFIKKFPDTELSELSPEQGEVEIFAQKNGLYIELENHGTYTTLKPGEHLTYKETWFLREADPSLLPAQAVGMVRRIVE